MAHKRTPHQRLRNKHAMRRVRKDRLCRRRGLDVSERFPPTISLRGHGGYVRGVLVKNGRTYMGKRPTVRIPLEDRSPLGRGCPRCKAKPGAPCVTPSGAAKQDFHKDRIQGFRS